MPAAAEPARQSECTATCHPMVPTHKREGMLATLLFVLQTKSACSVLPQAWKVYNIWSGVEHNNK
eukprot:1158314-Pelagomonas_calceolata.AAC.12